MTKRGAGFTLVEVLVALTVMAVIAGLAWRGVDGMLRARESTRASLDRTTRLNTVLTQWEQDLQAVFDTQGIVPAIAFDGQTLRLTRLVAGANTADGVQLVAWSLKNGQWMRWASPGVTRWAALQEHWLASQQLLGNEAQQLRLLEGVDEWQIYFYRGGRKTNAQSSGDVVAAPPISPAASTASGVGTGTPPPRLREALPEGVQLQLKLNGQTLTRDIALVPRA